MFSVEDLFTASFAIQGILSLCFCLWLIVFSKSDILRLPLRLVPYLLYVMVATLQFIPQRTIYLCGNLLIAAIYIIWLDYYAQQKTYLLLTIGLAVAGCGFTFGALLLEALFFRVLLGLTFGATLATLWFSLYEKRFHETHNISTIMTAIRLPLQILLIVTILPAPLLTLVEGEAFNLLLLPLVICLHFYVFLRLEQIATRDIRDRLTFVQENYASIFDYMSNINDILSEQIEQQSINTQEILDYVTSLVKDNVHADAGALLLVDEYEDQLNVKSTQGFFPIPYRITRERIHQLGVFHDLQSEIGGVVEDIDLLQRDRIIAIQDYIRTNPISFGETLLGETVANRKPLFIQDGERDPRSQELMGNGLTYFSSLLAYPLIVSSKLYGILCIGQSRASALFQRSGL